MRISFRFATIACLLYLLPCSGLPAQDNSVQPVLLQSANRSGERLAILDEGWFFMPGVFLDPGTANIPANALPVKVPANLLDIFGKDMPRFGTYICRIRIPWPERVSLKSEQFEMAYTLYANGTLVAASGKPGSSAETEEPGWSADIFQFPDPDFAGQVFTLVMHASSFNDSVFGFIRAFVLGEESALRNRRNKSAGYEILVVGVMLTMAAYYFVVWASRPREKSALAFAGLCLVLGLRPLFYGEFVIYYLWPGIGLEPLFRFGYLTMSLGMIIAPLFLHLMFPRSLPPLIHRLAAVIGGAYSLIIAFAPLRTTASLLVLVQAALLLLCLVLLGGLALALYRQESGALPVAVGVLLAAGAVILDILSARVLISLPPVMPLGLIGLILCLSIALTRSWSRAFDRVEQLAAELKRSNASMERFLPNAFLVQLGHRHHAEIGLGDYVELDMVVMFADIRNFTSISDELGPSGTFTFLNDWLARIGPIIRSHGGLVDKYLGDGILALFSPDSGRALDCAVAMQRETELISLDRQAAGFGPLQAGIGLHRGPLALGAIGEPERLDTTVISDTVNVASRLETVTKEFGASIIVSRELLCGAAEMPVGNCGGHLLRSLGKVSVKGKKQPVELFEVIDTEPEDQRLWKLSSADRFARGLELYFMQDFTAAHKLFLALVQENPLDQAAHYYARMSRKLGG